MQRMTVREYARRHKLSLFQVIKKINAGELPSETIEENGQSVQYVLLEKEAVSTGEQRPQAGTRPQPHEAQKNYELLAREITLLRREIELLRAELRRCCADGQERD